MAGQSATLGGGSAVIQFIMGEVTSLQSQILKYWYELEFFNPCWPVKPGDDTNLIKKDPPWRYRQTNPQIRENHDVYLGKVLSRDLIAWMLDSLDLDAVTKSIEQDNALSCLCALKVDEDGHYVADSFAVSSYIWAVCKLVSGRSFQAKLDVAELDAIQQSANKWLLPKDDEPPVPVTGELLHQVYASMCAAVHLKDDLMEPTLWSHKNTQHAKKDGKFPPLDPSTELLPSFYLKDLERIRQCPTPRVDRYINAMLVHPTKAQRIQIDTDVVQMKTWLRADAFPLGAWPSKYSPSLMQQLGINLAISEKQDIFSINGPPGTGKTTLLKEIVVSNVIQRSLVMLTYDSPDKAFEMKKFQDPPDQFNQNFYVMDKRLSAYGMLVASNNNAAVENISVELPKAIGKDRTGRFATPEVRIEDTYFSDVATKLLGEPAWGLISAKLGKRSNLAALKDRLWWSDDGVTLKRYFDGQDAPDWELARQNFRTSAEVVFEAQKDIIYAQELLAEQGKATSELTDARKKNEEVQTELAHQQSRLSVEEQTLAHLEETLTLQHQNIVTLKSSLSFFKRLFWKLFSKSPLVREWKQTEQAAEDMVIQITRQRTACQKQAETVRIAQVPCQLSEEALSQATQTLKNVNDNLAPYREKFGDNWADDAFWENISENAESQSACPWTNAEYDKLREELFFQALMLNKAFILNSKQVKQNLMRLFTLWDGKFSISDSDRAYGDLLNTLLLVIPVVSTTFASVQTFLTGVKAEELGVLVIDEAGQATPQSALGAIWRTRKAIVVGDPLQVEPIVTIPEELRKRFADENRMPPIYRVPELSVQMLADQLNIYGGIRKMNDESLWLGCPLVVHRRCLDPMFRISNEVAYNGRMFTKTAEADPTKHFLLQRSLWFDIKGKEKGNKDHTVPQQIEVVSKLLNQAIDVYGGLPSLYIITPFTSVARALKTELRRLVKSKLSNINPQELTDWLDASCGTIHTFQGKEADEVLLVLGCDAQSGKGAAQWVGRKPNIINVAVSRAKYRVGVIGDYDVWKSIPYVQTVCKYLEQQSEVSL